MPQPRATTTTKVDDLAKKREAMARALREARGDRPQIELGVAAHVPQTTISRWERGDLDLTYPQVYGIEQALGLLPGTLALQSGYTSPRLVQGDIEAAILASPDLFPELKEQVVEMVRGFMRVSQTMWAEQRKNGARRATKTTKR